MAKETNGFYSTDSFPLEQLKSTERAVNFENGSISPLKNQWINSRDNI